MKRSTLLLSFLIITFNLFAIDGHLIKTIDYSFADKWTKTLGDSTPKMSTCDTVFKKQFFFLTAVVSDYKLNKRGFSNVDYSIKILRPDNSTYFSQKNLPIINKRISNAKALQMSNAILKISFEDEDVYGTYKIQIEINDRVAKKTKKIESLLVLASLPAYDKYVVKDDHDFVRWLDDYYKDPQPENALAYYIYYSKSKFTEIKEGFLPVLSVLIEILKNNKFLYLQAMNCYGKQAFKTKVYLLQLLHYSGLGDAAFLNDLKGDEKKYYLELKKSPSLDFYGDIYDAAQLDMLWSTFSATGSYKPIFKLIETLEYSLCQGDLEKYKTSKKTEKDRAKAIYNAIYNSLVWSFKSNMKKDPLVRDYSNWIYEYGSLSEIQRDELKKLLNK